MSAGDLQNSLMTRVAAARGIESLSGTSKPTRNQVIAWLNEGTRDVQRRLLPRRLNTGMWTAGRLDKLLKRTYATGKTGASGFCTLPTADAHLGVSFYSAITLGSDAYSMKEVSLGEIWDRASGSFTPADASEGIFAWGESGGVRGIHYLPTSETAIAYYYVDHCAVMTYDTSEDFPLDDDLMPLVANYAIGKMWMSEASGKRNKALGEMFMEIYEAGINALVGFSNQIVREGQ